jgi:hypothetical protein
VPAIDANRQYKCRELLFAVIPVFALLNLCNEDLLFYEKDSALCKFDELTDLAYIIADFRRVSGRKHDFCCY